jgi:hypothetical protein
MRPALAGILILAAVLLAADAGRPAAATDQLSISDYRANFVVRPWGQRYTYRLWQYRTHHVLHRGPRYHLRLRRPGIDLQLRDRSWAPRVEVHHEGMK